MKIVTSCKFAFPASELLTDELQDFPQFYTEIYKVYLGYKQCYSRDLEEYKVDEDLDNIVGEERQRYMDLYAQYLSWLDQRSSAAIEEKPFGVYYQEVGDLVAGVPKYLSYLKMCWFIYNHMNHQSPLEHCQFQIHFKDMSRACQQQLTRHRVGTFNIQSQRYVRFFKDGDESDAGFFISPSIARHEDATALYREYLKQLPEVVQRIRDLGYKDIKEEDLRYLYPNAMVGDGIWSVNLRSLMHFLEERCCFKAQYEIRQFARQIRSFLCHTLPFIGAKLGPKCYVLGYCPETKSCGTIKTRIPFEPKLDK